MIEIGDKYRLSSDKYQFILGTASKGTRKDTGEEFVSYSDSYYPTIKQVINKITSDNLMTGLNEYSDLKELVLFMKQSQAEMIELLKGVKR